MIQLHERRTMGGDDNHFEGVKVFSSTMVRHRERMGDDVIAWLSAHPEFIAVDTVVRQSSDSRFHCFTILIFWRVDRG